MALSIGFRIFSFLPSCYSSYGVLNFYPDGTFTHCSCQPSLDAHLAVLNGMPALLRFGDNRFKWLNAVYSGPQNSDQAIS
jgi:hypothetical protein